MQALEERGLPGLPMGLPTQHRYYSAQHQDWQQDMATLWKRVVLGIHERRLTLK